jgi:FAD/FMN-containing dehydrogenase
VIEELRAVVGAQHVLVDADLRAGYEIDWTGRYRGSTPCVVRPGSVDEVAAVVRLCGERGAAIVPQGGNTGLVGGGVPLDGEVVLSLQRFTGIEPVDVLSSQVTVGAGVTCAAVDEAAGSVGLHFAVDLGARDTATIGGMVATNAGGLHLLRHGGMRQNVVGIEAVLGNGDIVRHLGGLPKDNTGYDLTSLVCGSEGTLAVVTAVGLRLVPQPRELVTAVLGVPSVAHAVELVATMRRSVDLEAAEVWVGMDGPIDAPVHVLIEWAGGDVGALGPVAAEHDAVIADGETRRAELWRYRDGITESINRAGIPHKMDVTLPLPALADFCADVLSLVERVQPGARTFLFGHVGDGNIHVNVVGPDPDDDAVDLAVFALVAERGGSISAEHGIGTAKKASLHLSRSVEEIAAMRAIKRALDPKGILNPNVLLP